MPDVFLFFLFWKVSSDKALLIFASSLPSPPPVLSYFSSSSSPVIAMTRNRSAPLCLPNVLSLERDSKRGSVLDHACVGPCVSSHVSLCPRVKKKKPKKTKQKTLYLCDIALIYCVLSQRCVGSKCAVAVFTLRGECLHESLWLCVHVCVEPAPGYQWRFSISRTHIRGTSVHNLSGLANPGSHILTHTVTHIHTYIQFVWVQHLWHSSRSLNSCPACTHTHTHITCTCPQQDT